MNKIVKKKVRLNYLLTKMKKRINIFTVSKKDLIIYILQIKIIRKQINIMNKTTVNEKVRFNYLLT